MRHFGTTRFLNASGNDRTTVRRTVPNLPSRGHVRPRRRGWTCQCGRGTFDTWVDPEVVSNVAPIPTAFVAKSGGADAGRLLASVLK
jgi:hypothetical protein